MARAGYKNAEGERTTVPFHGSKILHPKLLHAILKDAGLTADRFRELMQEVVEGPDLRVKDRRVGARLRTCIVAPLTTGAHPSPFRVPCRFAGKAGFLVLDQIRTVDRERLGRRLGRLAPPTLSRTLAILQEMFAA